MPSLVSEIGHGSNFPLLFISSLGFTQILGDRSLCLISQPVSITATSTLSPLEIPQASGKPILSINHCEPHKESLGISSLSNE